MSWEETATLQTKLKMNIPHSVLEIAYHSLPDDSIGVSAPELSSDDSSGSSSTSSSPKSNRSIFPAAISDDYAAAKAIDINDCDFHALHLTSRPDHPVQITPSNEELCHDLQDGYKQNATSSQLLFPGERCVYSRTTVVNLEFPDSVSQGLKTAVMDAKLHFQVLIGSLADSLSISPELLDLTVQRGSQTVRLSPIASLYELGYSNELTVQVWVRKAAIKSTSNLPAFLNQPRRIPGTKWIHSFPSTKRKLGLPSSPACPGKFM
ncbi:hypothetical protein PCASD_08820 [Puccinia coronata f. sp. avenae]|uniref:Uncharacterized protein n=2 Tax=Puccinia coronata f. sp. avenae TaxID=200324 RepID=A0A2N5URX9_9BASI|nr:hypothetical protein PCASD_21363 [Puccinia coronata f. sp. avenae]PLW40528.1 hypothetical protein PCASD_08820 [Puccinia coronata f. sp. avenae]